MKGKEKTRHQSGRKSSQKCGACRYTEYQAASACGHFLRLRLPRSILEGLRELPLLRHELEGNASISAFGKGSELS